MELDNLPSAWLPPLLSGQRKLLERMAAGDPLPELLADLCRLVEDILPHRQCAVLVASGGILRVGGAPSLPEAFLAAVDGSGIGPGTTPCGLAAMRREAVVVTDLTTDPAWAHVAPLARTLHLACCATLPIPGPRGECLGTFALYGTEPEQIPPPELELMGACAAIASAALRTHQREAEASARLVQSEAHYRQTFQNLPVPAFIWDPTTHRLLAVNAAALTAYGYSSAEFLSLRMQDLRFSEDQQRMDELLLRMPRGYHRAGPVRHRTREGAALVVDLSSHDVIFDGQPARVTVALNLTERLQMEERYGQLVEAVAEGIAIVDDQDVFEFANPAAHGVFGAEPGTLPGQPLAAYLPEGQLEVLHRETHLRQQGLASSYSLTIQRPSGDQRTLEVKAVPRVSPEGRYQGAFVLFLDITDRIEAERALRQSEDRFRTLFEEIPLGVVIHADGRIQFANRQATQAVGLGAPQEAVGKSILPFLSPEDLALTIARQREVQAGREVPWIEMHHRKLDGTDFPVESRIMLLEPGPPPTFLSVFQDISERRRTEEGMRQAQKLESLGVLAGGIAHDFNNLLTAMMGNLNLAQMALSEGHPAHPYLGSLESAVTRASDLTRQMLAYSGRGRFVVKTQDLNALVADMANLLKVSISKRVTLATELTPNLPCIEADASQLQQVVMNLVINANEAIGEGDGAIQLRTSNVALSAEDLRQSFPGQDLSPGPHVLLEVDDTGSGMPQEVLARIFDPFFTTKVTGRGLGLSAIQGILRGHRAGIRIESRIGIGSCFRVYFPATLQAQDTPLPPAVEQEQPRGGRILLVDDEPALRSPLKDVLEMLGFQVIEAGDGIEAMERYHEVSGDILAAILDLTMPRMDGRETLEALRQVSPDLPVLLSSGYEEGEALERLMANGPTAFLQKPYTLKALRAALLDLLPKG